MTDRSEDLLAQRRLGYAIRHLRTERGLTRRQLEKATGLSYPYLSEIEAGKKSPSSRSLRVIADALGLEAHELLEAAEAAGQTPGPEVSEPSHFHQARARFDLLSESPSPLSPMARQGKPKPPASAQVGRVFFAREDIDAAELEGTLSLEEARRQLARLAKDLSPEDLSLLIWLASRLRG